MATPRKEDKDGELASLPPALVPDTTSTANKDLGVYKSFHEFDNASLRAHHRQARSQSVSSTQSKSLLPPKDRATVVPHEPPLSRPSGQASSKSVTASSPLCVPKSSKSKSAWSTAASAASKGGAAARLVGAGGVLVCDKLRRILGEHKIDPGTPIDQNLVKAILESGTKAEQYENAVKNFLAFCASVAKIDLPADAGVSHLTWMQLRDRSVSELTKLASNIDKHHKNVNITTVATASVGVTAGAIALGAILAPFTFGAYILAPFTFGVSAVVGAAAVGATAGLTALGASLTEMGLTKSTCSTAQKYIDADVKQTEKLYYYIDGLNECAEALRLSTQKLDRWDSLEVVKTVFVGIECLGTVASSAPPLARGAMMANPGVRNLAKQMVKVPKAQWAAQFGTRASGKTWSAAKSIAKQCPSLAGKGACVFGDAMAGVGIVFDVYTLITTSIDLANGSVSAAGKALREKANLLQSEKAQIAHLIKELRNSQN